jgi:menaquinone-dependent protoporphyrinogen IX oxidase
MNMPYDDSKKEILSNLSIILLESLIDCNSEKYNEIIVIGDFNADFRRNNRFDNLLYDFVMKNNLIITSKIAIFRVEFSYKKGDYRSEKG